MEFVKWLLLGGAFAALIASTLGIIERAAQSTVALLAGVLGLIVGGLLFGVPIMLVARSRLARAALNEARAAPASTPSFAYQPPTIIMPPAYSQPAAPSLPLFERGLDEVGAGARFYGAEPAYPMSNPAPTGYTARALPPRVNWDVL